jgi:hypothetical protein
VLVKSGEHLGAILSCHGELSSSSILAFATAQASGFAIKVGPCINVPTVLEILLMLKKPKTN